MSSTRKDWSSEDPGLFWWLSLLLCGAHCYCPWTPAWESLLLTFESLLLSLQTDPLVLSRSQPSWYFSSNFRRAIDLESFHSEPSHPAQNALALALSLTPFGETFGGNSRSGLYDTIFFSWSVHPWHSLELACWNGRCPPCSITWAPSDPEANQITHPLDHILRVYVGENRLECIP